MSSDSTKKTIEKNPQGAYDFTPYGEFLSYFHAHLEIFKRFCKEKNVPSAKTNQDISKLKSYMASNIKNVDQYFPNIPKFAEIMGVPKDQLSDFLNKKFLEILPTVQEKFKNAEIKKIENSPDREFDRITEEILEKTGFVFPDSKVFKQKGMLVVLEDTNTGEILEPQGLMAGISAPPPAMIGADPKESKPTPTKIIPDHPILEELSGIFEGDNSEEKLVPLSEKEEEQNQEVKEEIKASEDDILEDIDDLDFEEPESDDEADNYSEDNHSHAEGVLDDLDDILSMGSDPEPEEKHPVIPDEIQEFEAKDYFDIVRNILGFQTKKDSEGYKSWLGDSSDLIKVAVAFRTHHLKESKGEVIPWDSLIEQMQENTSYNSTSLNLLKEKVIQFNWVRIGLDKGLAELRKGTPDLINIVKKAWPHLQTSFYDSPDYEKVLSNLKIIIGKIPDPQHKKEVGRVMTLVLNFLKSKVPN